MKKYVLEFYGKNFTLLVLNLYEYNLNSFEYYLNKKIKEFPKLFKKAPIILNILPYIKISDWILIKKLILFFKFKIIGFSNCENIKLKKYIISSGIPYFNISKKDFLYNIKNEKNKNKNNKFEKKYYKTITIDYPVRSGQKIYSKNSDLIIISNVSPGAEIISNRNIHIYGTLRGKALAGSLGDTSAKIFCKCCLPELISISGNYLLYDQIPKKNIGKSVYFFLKDNNLKVKKL
ncbi:septum site-determining protein MinC [Buchnera aphidicola (Ceratoglyphina bambusae)]|uniref:septum site-determining protein MinC n=1 Tax=Buchnera aphidicola TaxID=9 RepID=UPI0031B83DA8